MASLTLFIIETLALYLKVLILLEFVMQKSGVLVLFKVNLMCKSLRPEIWDSIKR